MINLQKLVSELNITDPEYISYLEKKYTDFITLSDIPQMCFEHNIDVTTLSSRLKILNDNIYTIISNRDNYSFNVQTYSHTNFLSSLLLDSYFESCIKNEVLLENVIYVDTNLILDDYKKLMDSNNMTNLQISLSHKLETITKYIETAPFVIWDKFSLINSNYDKQKLYNILLSRARKGNGNIFFIKNAPNVLANVLDEEIVSIMNITDSLVDLSHQKITYLENKTKEEIQW